MRIKAALAGVRLIAAMAFVGGEIRSIDQANAATATPPSPCPPGFSLYPPTGAPQEAATQYYCLAAAIACPAGTQSYASPTDFIVGCCPPPGKAGTYGMCENPNLANEVPTIAPLCPPGGTAVNIQSADPETPAWMCRAAIKCPSGQVFSTTSLKCGINTVLNHPSLNALPPPPSTKK
jgi:hypothetical protein